ncbi:hypothetical protein [Paraliobacillus zengyii]|uniref:hypothetical protein n=1 Tax=Paraliobacillus zengyii TaxID=2213194 RepID=UPI000DD442C2|nr:hypothetical protein [Paraliobacillus zengyii]
MYVLPKGLFEPLFEPIKSGFFIVIAVTTLLLIFMMLKQKNSKSPYVWLIIHFVVLALSGYLFFNTISPPTIPELPQSIIYDEVRIRLSFVGITWIISLICLLIGIRKFQKQAEE